MPDYRLTETRRRYVAGGGEPLTDEEWLEFDERQRDEAEWTFGSYPLVRHRREHVRVIRYEAPTETPSIGHIANLRYRQAMEIMFHGMLPTEDLAYKAMHAFEQAYDLHPDVLVEWLEKGLMLCFQVAGRWVLEKSWGCRIPSREELADMFRRAEERREARTPFDDDTRESDGSVTVFY